MSIRAAPVVRHWLRDARQLDVLAGDALFGNRPSRFGGVIESRSVVVFNYPGGLGSSWLGRGVVGVRGCCALVCLFVVSGWFDAAASGRGPEFELVGVQAAPGGSWDFLPDGRIISIIGAEIFREISPQAGSYELVGVLPSGLIAPWGASFLAVSPDGGRFLVGDNNFDGAFVYLLETGDLNGGLLTPRSFPQENFNAEWRDDQNIAISYGNPATLLGEVAVLNIDAAQSIPVLTIGGAAAGVTFDEAGNLLSANGFDFVGGGSETGAVRAFAAAEIDAVLRGQAPVIDFDTAGVPIVRALSGAPLNFDVAGNLFVGGGRADESDFFVIADAGAVADAVGGFGAVNAAEIFSADPVADAGSIYGGRFNSPTNEWLVDGADGLLYRYVQVSCLELTVDQLTAGAVSTFTIAPGTPGQRVALVYGWERGTTLVRQVPQICADFGIRGVLRKRLLGGAVYFDANGIAEALVSIPQRVQGQRLFFQAAQAGTCPAECVSKVLAARVE